MRRKRDPNDRRVVMVELTDDGLELIRSIFPRHAAVVAEEMSILSPEERRQLGELCKKLGKGRSASASNSRSRRFKSFSSSRFCLTRRRKEHKVEDGFLRVLCGLA